MIKAANAKTRNLFRLLPLGTNVFSPTTDELFKDGVEKRGGSGFKLFSTDRTFNVLSGKRFVNGIVLFTPWTFCFDFHCLTFSLSYLAGRKERIMFVSCLLPLSEFSNSYLHNFLAGAFRYYYILGNQQKNVAALFYDK